MPPTIFPSRFRTSDKSDLNPPARRDMNKRTSLDPDLAQPSQPREGQQPASAPLTASKRGPATAHAEDKLPSRALQHVSGRVVLIGATSTLTPSALTLTSSPRTNSSPTFKSFQTVQTKASTVGQTIPNCNADTMTVLNTEPVQTNKTVDMSLSSVLAGNSETLQKNRKTVAKPGSQFSLTEPCLYTHRMFVRAAKIFQFLLRGDSGAAPGGVEVDQAKSKVAVDNGDIPELDFESPQEQMKTFELTFAALKFQKLFSGILEQTGFFADFPDLQDHYSLVCIVLFDLRSRKFQKRKPLEGEALDQLCEEVEQALVSRKTRFQSCIAKERIKHQAPSIEHLLPEHVRNKDETKTKTPVYLWVNQIKTTLPDMVADLEAHKFTRLEPDLDITEQTSQVFQVDTHLSDVLVFPPHLDMYFKDTRWVKSGLMVQQDKSSCLAPQSVQHLLGIDQDVIHVNVGTGASTAHLASLLWNKSPHSHIWGFGAESGEKAKRAAKNLEFLGAKNTKILLDNFLNVDPDEPKFRAVRVILVSANCSKSAITSPVQFIVSEGEDMRFLGELSKADQGMTSLPGLAAEHERLLRHALKFPRVQAVVYCTRSRHSAENELVVEKALDYINSTGFTRNGNFKVTPPVLPFSSDQIDTGMSGVDNVYVRFLPSDKSNGCFVAVLAREPEDPKDVARSAVARARSKGFLGKSKFSQQTLSNGDLSEDEELSSTGLRDRKSRSRKLRSVGSKHRPSPAAVSRRLYQMGLAQKGQSEDAGKLTRPEHLKIVKHPAPFR